MESGNHKCPTIWADFIEAATTKNKREIFKSLELNVKFSKTINHTDIDWDFKIRTMYAININKNRSLNLLKTNALKLAFIVPLRKDQKFIRKNEFNPISSQPKYSNNALSEMTNNDILIINQFNKITNLSAWGSFLK